MLLHSAASPMNLPLLPISLLRWIASSNCPIGLVDAQVNTPVEVVGSMHDTGAQGIDVADSRSYVWHM